MKSLQKGFTLIELVAVMVIIAVLSGIAAPKYLDMSDKAKETADKASVAGVESTLTLLIGKNTGSAEVHPSVTALAAAVKGNKTAVAAGVCVSAGKRVNTFKDDIGTPTAAVGDLVYSTASSVTPDGSCT